MLDVTKRYITRGRVLVQAIEVDTSSAQKSYKVLMRDYNYKVNEDGRFYNGTSISNHDLFEIPDHFGSFVEGENYITRGGLPYTVGRILNNPITDEDKEWLVANEIPGLAHSEYSMVCYRTDNTDKQWLTLTPGGLFYKGETGHLKDLMSIELFELTEHRKKLEAKQKEFFDKLHTRVKWERPDQIKPTKPMLVYITILVGSDRMVEAAQYLFAPTPGFYTSQLTARPIREDRVLAWTPRPEIPAYSSF